MLLPKNAGSEKGGFSMAPVKTITKEFDWRELLFSIPESEPRSAVECAEPADDEEILPEIVDLLGCFCMQTGAQFG